MAVPGTVIITPSEECLLGFGLVWYLDNDIGSLVQNDSQTSIKAGPLWRNHLSIPSEFASHVIQRSSLLGGRGHPLGFSFG